MKNLFLSIVFLGLGLASYGQSTSGYKSVISEDFSNNKLGWSQNTSTVNKAWIDYSRKVMILDVKDSDDRRSIGYTRFDFNEDFILKAVVGIKEDEIKSNEKSRIGIVFGYTSHDYTQEQGWYAVFLDVLEDKVTIRANNRNGSQLYENEVKTSYDIAGKTTVGVKKEGGKLSVFINEKSIFENVSTETVGGAVTLIAKNKVRGLFYSIDLYEKDVPPTPEEVAVKEAVSADEEKVMVEAISNLEFDTGKSTLRPTSHAALNKMAEMMTRNTKFRVILTGHTDNVGDPKSNLKLSQDRVNAVVDFLVSKGIDKGRFAALGYGDQRPVADNDTPEGRQKNRRVEFEIVL